MVNTLTRKLSEDEAKAILASDEYYPILAERYGVSHTVISRIKNRRTWVQLPIPEGGIPKHTRGRPKKLIKTPRVLKKHSAEYRHSQAKLTHAQVKEIRDLYRGVTQAELAERYGVTQAAISRIVTKKNWKEVAQFQSKDSKGENNV